MRTHCLVQGSSEWKAYRLKHFNASDAPAMMGCSKHKPRAALLRELHTEIVADVPASAQRLFDAGHRFEDLARPLGEQIIGEDLYPVTGSSGHYSASFDGLPLGKPVPWEHKTINDELRAVLPTEGVGDATVGDALPLMYRVQMEHQCMVAGADTALFTASKWQDDGELVEARHCWYAADASLRADIQRGWAQFAADLADYVLPPAEDAKPVGKAPATLPALRVEVQGMVTHSNLAEFKTTALTAIRSVNRDLQTDQDFADADKAIKWCEDVEDRIKATKAHALSQTASIEELFRVLDEISSESKTVRLDITKLRDRRKVERKEEAVTAARKALDAHIAKLNGELAPMRIAATPVDFAGAIKGLRSIASMQDALDTALAGGKIDADDKARSIRANLATFKAQSAGFEFLFADLAQMVHKSTDDFGLLVAARIAAHKADEAEKKRKAGLRADVEKIRAASAVSAGATSAEIHEVMVAVTALNVSQERYQEFTGAAEAAQDEAMAALQDLHFKAREREEAAARASDEAQRPAVILIDAGDCAEAYTAKSTSPVDVPLIAGELGQIDGRVNIVAGPAGPAPQAVESPAQEPLPALTMGMINDRIAPFKIDGAGLAKLGFQPADQRGGAKLFHERVWQKMHKAMQDCLAAAA